MTVYLGDTIQVQATLRDYHGNVLTPTYQEITLYDSSGTQKALEKSPTAEGSGIYHVDFVIPADGDPSKDDKDWTVVWKATYLVKSKYERIEIEVKSVS